MVGIEALATLAAQFSPCHPFGQAGRGGAPGGELRSRCKGDVQSHGVGQLEGAQGHFVWVVDRRSSAQIRNVQVGPWQGDQWFIDSGLSAGDLVVVEGFMKLSAGSPVKIASHVAPPRETRQIETRKAMEARP